MKRSTYARCALVVSLVGCGLPADEADAGDVVPSDAIDDGVEEESLAQAVTGEGLNVAPGYTLETNCPNLGGLSELPVPTSEEGGNTLRPAHMAFDAYGKKLYIVYQSTSARGQVHVRDLVRCTQSVLIDGLTEPLGVAVHPNSGKLYVTHKYYLDPTRTNPSGDESNVRSAVSVFDARRGSLLVDKLVKNLPPANFGLPFVNGNGAQGLSFDPAGNLYIAMNVDVFEEARNPAGNKASSILKVDRNGNVSVFASGLRATFDAVVAKTNGRGEATAFYATDNGEGDYCVEAGPGCEGRNRANRMSYDELNFVVKGGFYGYPESAPGVAATATTHRSHIGPLHHFDKIVGGQFDNQWPVPTGVSVARGDWGKVENPVFVAYWRAGVDMFSGPGLTKRTPLVTGLDQTIDVVVHPTTRALFVAEYNTGLIYVVKPKAHLWWRHPQSSHR